MANTTVKIHEDEMNRIIEILGGCKEESDKVWNAVLAVQTELKDNIYEGDARTSVVDTTNYLAQGMYRMSVIYEQLGLILGDILKKFKDIDDKEGENAKKAVTPANEQDR